MMKDVKKQSLTLSHQPLPDVHNLKQATLGTRYLLTHVIDIYIIGTPIKRKADDQEPKEEEDEEVNQVEEEETNESDNEEKQQSDSDAPSDNEQENVLFFSYSFSPTEILPKLYCRKNSR